MITIRHAHDRGHTRKNWLESWHTFSFETYYEPKHKHFRNLRVINQDIIAPKLGFGLHAHSDMEIMTYVLKGSLTHRDSMENEAIIQPGEIQIMSAGSGVSHSEFNSSQTESVEFLQIWILPDKKSLTPSYQQRKILKKENELTLVASSLMSKSSVLIHQDVKIFVCQLSAGHELDYVIQGERFIWLQIVKGKFLIDNELVSAGDGVSVSALEKIKITALHEGELLLFDLS